MLCSKIRFGARRGAGANTQVCPHDNISAACGSERGHIKPVILLKFACSAGLLSLVLSVATFGQTGWSNLSGPSSELYGCIELSDEGAKAIVAQVSQGGEEPGFRLIYSDFIRLKLGRTGYGEYPPQASSEAARAVLTLITRLRQQYRVPPDRTYFFGSSRLEADHPPDLVPAIRKMTGLTLKFLDPVTEVQLKIAGTIPRTQRIGDTTIDNRNTSMLFHIGVSSTQGGYEMLKYATTDSPAFDFVTMNIPHGVVSYANEISQAVGPSSSLLTYSRQVRATAALTFRQALRKEMESKPGLAHRNRVFLTGPLAWAMVTILYPENKDDFVSIAFDDLTQFVDRATRSPRELVLRDLSFIRDRQLRQAVEQDMTAIKEVFTPQQLMAGAEMLRAAADELKWRDKTIVFARRGHLGSILSYVRLQTGK